jgi:transcriptional regulator NrdR family protein
MKCPSMKGKKPCGGELHTKRTLANGNKVTRERYCPKCKNRLMTIEQFETDIQQAEVSRNEQIRSADQENLELRSQLDEYKELLLSFRNLLEKAAGTVQGARGGR